MRPGLSQRRASRPVAATGTASLVAGGSTPAGDGVRDTWALPPKLPATAVMHPSRPTGGFAQTIFQPARAAKLPERGNRPMSYRIFIVEDDAVIASSIERHIRSWGCQTRCASNFQNVLQEFVAFDPQLVILDIILPFYNGYHWCSEIRKVSKVPILFLSSASDNMNIVMAVNMGGDDFVAKPFDLDVLTAKVQAMLRRAYDFGGQVELMEHRGAILNTADASLTYQGERVELTKNEYKILQTLLSNKGKTVSRDTLMTKLWETDCYVDENTLSVNINRLRKKLDAAGLHDFILTKKGIGYLVE